MSAPLGLIAGGGRLPFEVAEAALEQGRALAIAAIENQTDPAIARYAPDALLWIAPGELGRLIEFLKSAEVREVIFAGAVTKREMLTDPARLRPDARALAALARLEGRGDDAVLRAAAAELESDGLQVIESTRYLRDRLASVGPLNEVEIDAAVAADLALGLRVARALGVEDVGQSVVVRDGVVLAVEALEGTDAAIRRGAALGGAGAVAVKTAKPTQDVRFDVPAVGPATIEVACECGLRAIGLEAGRTLLLERERTLEAATRCGVALVGLEHAGDAPRPGARGTGA
jgi:DUF1009 family protein